MFFTSSCETDDAEPPIHLPEFELSKPPFELDVPGAKFAEDIAYGSGSKRKLDFYFPKSAKPTGVVVYIHGGGFSGGDKDSVYTMKRWKVTREIRYFLSRGIAVANVNYSLLKPVGREQVGMLKSLSDIKRAVQYIRYRAADFNIRKEDVVLTGFSAGAGAAFWLGVIDDLKDSESEELLERESTRIKGVALRQVQSTYDLESRWFSEVFADYDMTWSRFFNENRESVFQLYGVQDSTQYASTKTAKYRELLDMLRWLSWDDPEIWAANTRTPVVPPDELGLANHHAYHVRTIKHYADSAGVPIVCYYGRDPLIYGDPSEESFVQFVERKLRE